MHRQRLSSNPKEPIMSRSNHYRFAAAMASVAITFSLLNGLALMAKPAPAPMTLAQATTTVVAQAATAKIRR